MAARQTLSFLIKRFRESGIEPVARYGQNFLIDLNLVEILADAAAIEPCDVVLEVGTGTGSLTALLASKAAVVITVEIDSRLQQLAREELVGADNVIMLRQDALKNKNNFDPGLLELIDQQLRLDPQRRFKLAANLPYNIATPIISNLLLTPHTPVSMTVTIQKELADRILARPNNKDYGALSLWMQSLCEVQLVRVLPPSVFWPRPKVHSAILHIVPQPAWRERFPDLRFFHGYTRAVFLHRRKYLRGGLVGVLKGQLDKPQVDQLMNALELGPEARAEQLDLGQHWRLCEAIRQMAPEAFGHA